jgi:DNA-binding GntR family transcriptional regulator
MKLGENETIDIPATISETIYKYLKNAIVEGKLKPNEKITERRIAQIFQVSASPVREAFQRLAAESLIKISARKEVTVSSMTINEIVEIFEVIRTNDIYATKKALENLSDQDIAEIQKLTEKLKDFFKKNDFPHYYEVNLKIHDLIWKACGNKHLYQTLSNLSQKLYIHQNLVFELTQDPDFFARSHQDHLDLQKAVEQRDVKSALKILKSHWAKGFLNKKMDLQKEF